MRITGLKLHNFRNYRDLEQSFEPGLTVFTGLNGRENESLCASYRCESDNE